MFSHEQDNSEIMDDTAALGSDLQVYMEDRREIGQPDVIDFALLQEENIRAPTETLMNIDDDEEDITIPDPKIFLEQNFLPSLKRYFINTGCIKEQSFENY